jgi:hypothetical protein
MTSGFPRLPDGYVWNIVEIDYLWRFNVSIQPTDRDEAYKRGWRAIVRATDDPRTVWFRHVTARRMRSQLLARIA